MNKIKALFKNYSYEVKVDGFIEIEKEIKRIHSWEMYEKHGKVLDVYIDYIQEEKGSEKE